jgi:hypothetical protein
MSSNNRVREQLVSHNRGTVERHHSRLPSCVSGTIHRMRVCPGGAEALQHGEIVDVALKGFAVRWGL